MMKRWEAFFYLIWKLMKLATKSLLRLSNESMVPGGQLSKPRPHRPFKVVEKALHITSSEYPWSNIRLLYESKWSIGSVFPSQTSSWVGNLNLEETLVLITLFVNRGSVYLINVSIVIGTLAPVLMALIRASRSLIF